MGKKILGEIAKAVFTATCLASMTFGLAAFVRMGWDFGGQDSKANDPQNEEEA